MAQLSFIVIWKLEIVANFIDQRLSIKKTFGDFQNNSFGLLLVNFFVGFIYSNQEMWLFVIKDGVTRKGEKLQ